MLQFILSPSVDPWSLSGYWEEFVRYQLRTNETYSEPNVSLVPETGMFLWMPRLLISGGRLEFVTATACWWRWWTGVRVGWQSWSALWSFWWQAVQESVDLPLTWHPPPRLTSFAFRSSEVRHLLLDLDPYGGGGALAHWVCSLFFIRELMFWPPVLM